jgi:hypothetical protein
MKLRIEGGDDYDWDDWSTRRAARREAIYACWRELTPLGWLEGFTWCPTDIMPSLLSPWRTTTDRKQSRMRKSPFGALCFQSRKLVFGLLRRLQRSHSLIWKCCFFSTRISTKCTIWIHAYCNLDWMATRVSKTSSFLSTTSCPLRRWRRE